MSTGELITNKADTSKYQFKGYTFILRGETCGQHGGLVIYLYNTFNLKK